MRGRVQEECRKPKQQTCDWVNVGEERLRDDSEIFHPENWVDGTHQSHAQVLVPEDTEFSRGCARAAPLRGANKWGAGPDNRAGAQHRRSGAHHLDGGAEAPGASQGSQRTV